MIVVIFEDDEIDESCKKTEYYLENKDIDNIDIHLLHDFALLCPCF